MSDPAVTVEAAREERLARLLTELTDQARRGQPVRFDAIVQLHPDLADELRPLWATAQLAEELGRSVAEPPAVPPESPPSLPRSFGDYELLELLGQGGMGVVYRAWDQRLNRQVALKMILRGELATPVDLARFRAEAEATARLDHPHIVPVYEVGEHDGQSYFTMRYVAGTTLARRLAAGPLPPCEAAQLIAQISGAVYHAHQAGILHRDLKPANILLAIPPASSLTTDHWPLVTDFGLAKRVAGGEHLTQTGAILGTPSYMAPEQAFGTPGALGPASDVYSLGAMLYEMLTGRPPFQAATALDTLLLVRDQDLVRPRLLNPKVDPDLELICLKCLEKSPDLRYTSAAQLADSLETFLRGEPIPERRGSLRYFLGHILRDTHHAPVLENWGKLWIWHSFMMLAICLVTVTMYRAGFDGHFSYLVLWGVGLLVWGMCFWALRKNLGPVTFVERQLAHMWAAGVLGSVCLFAAEWLQDLPVLSLSPGLAVLAALVFLIKAGVLSGEFYLTSLAMFVTSGAMLFVPLPWGVLLFGAVSGIGFFIPGLRYYRINESKAVRK